MTPPAEETVLESALKGAQWEAFKRDVWPKVKLPEGAKDKQVAAAMDRAWKQYLREQNL